MTRLTPRDPRGYRNYNQGSYLDWPDLMLSWWKGSTALCQFQVDPFLFTSSFGIRLRLQRSDWVWLRFRKLLYKKPTKRNVFKGKDCIIGFPKGKCKSIEISVLWQSAFYTDQRSQVYSPRAMLNCHTCTRRHTHRPMGLQPAPLPLPLQVKRPTQRGHMTQALAFLPILLCISRVHETLRHPPLLSLAHARLLVAVAESRACQEPCLGATWNDKMRMRARGWHMVLISSQVYQGPLTTEYNQTYSQRPAHWTSSHPHWFPQNATDKESLSHYFKHLLQEETLKLCLLN